MVSDNFNEFVLLSEDGKVAKVAFWSATIQRNKCYDDGLKGQNNLLQNRYSQFAEVTQLSVPYPYSIDGTRTRH
jgi:hypothetical protein